jgi:hypothetical protein
MNWGGRWAEALLYARPRVHASGFWVNHARVLVHLAEEVLAVDQVQPPPPQVTKAKAS